MDAGRGQWLALDSNAALLIIARREGRETRAMDEEWLGVIRGRLAAATPGPWEKVTYVQNAGVGIFGQDFLIAETLRRRRAGREGAQIEHDMEFIAHAPADIQALLAEVEHLQAELWAAKRAHDETAQQAQRVLNENRAKSRLIFARDRELQAARALWDVFANSFDDNEPRFAECFEAYRAARAASEAQQ